jgi:DNA (cytosine-5)-methyltransferase 1
MTHLSLFTGIGGLDLAAEMAGFCTVGQVEIDDYCNRVLEHHWPGVPKWRDVRDVTVESVQQRGIGEITVLSGGFPCQPFSEAGKRRGAADDRYLWPEMLRIIQELQPRWVVGENVFGFVDMGLDKSLFDLEGAGYTCQAFIIPACAVGAPHKRNRVFIIGCSLSNHPGNGNSKFQEPYQAAPATRFINKQITDGLEAGWREVGFTERWKCEPGVGRMVHGFSGRVDPRIKALGNAVSPAQAYPIFRAIMEIEVAGCMKIIAEAGE